MSSRAPTWLLVVTVLACTTPGAVAGSAPTPTRSADDAGAGQAGSSSSTGSGPDEADAPSPEGADAPSPEGADAPSPEGVDAPSPEGGDAPSPEGADAPSSSWLDAESIGPCEVLCAQVHGCLLQAGEEPAAAASIELGCLGACVAAPTAFSRCAPEPVAAAPQERCEEFSSCVRAAWPGDGGEVEAPQVDPIVDGCTAACKRFADCEGAGIEAAQKCGELCRGALSEGNQERIGECAALDDCVQVEMCIRSFPGA